ncbi:MAG TPA: twin-arginine translocation signal domain-containing protein, partial [Anaerolineales bacterium]|nr:twin-arginine translocation signal domain-containing protein [Anaerolineales bacterium]
MASPTYVSRRDFLKLSAGSVAALGLSLLRVPGFVKLLQAAVEEVPVIWLQAGTCTGCSVSVLNSLSPTIQEVLVDQVLPGKHLSLGYHATIMAAAGDLAMEAMEQVAVNKGGFVLVAEGAFATKDEGVYCEIGERAGHGITALEHLTRLGADAMAVLALGTCAAYGGIPAAPPNPTGCQSVGQVFAEHGITTPVINLPGCPPHPDWFVGTVATVLIGGLEGVEVDDLGRPVAFYGPLIHDNCARRGHFDAGRFAKKFSDPYCLYELGCKGPVTHADCSIRLWNGGNNWCVGCGHPCIGCVEPDFPQEGTLYELPSLHTLTPPTTYAPAQEEEASVSPAVAGTVGAAAGLAVG